MWTCLFTVCHFSLSIQNIHELRFPSLQFQDAKYRVPESSPKYLHCGVWDSHLCLHPQPPLLLLLNKVTPMHLLALDLALLRTLIVYDVCECVATEGLRSLGNIVYLLGKTNH